VTEVNTLKLAQGAPLRRGPAWAQSRRPEHRAPVGRGAASHELWAAAKPQL